MKIEVEIFEVFCVPNDLRYFRNYDDAVKVDQGRNPGQHNTPHSRKLLLVNGNYYVLGMPLNESRVQHSTEDDEFQAALNKLTPREREILGIKFMEPV